MVEIHRLNYVFVSDCVYVHNLCVSANTCTSWKMILSAIVAAVAILICKLIHLVFNYV